MSTASTSVIFIYCLCEPQTGEIRYVGKTVDIENRHRQHLQSVGKNSHKENWIKSLIARGLVPEIKVLETIMDSTGNEWKDRERMWIERYRSAGARLTNLDAGGYGPSRVSPETREKIRQSQLGRKMPAWLKEKLRLINTGRKLQAEHVEKVRLALIGRKVTNETREKISKGHLGKPLSDEHRRKLSVSHTGLKYPDGFSEKMRAILLADPNLGKRMELVRLANKGKTRPQETRDKISATRIARKIRHTDATKQKLREIRFAQVERMGQ